MPSNDQPAAKPPWLLLYLRLQAELNTVSIVAENQRLRQALIYYAEGRYPDGGELAREALADV